MHPAAGSRAGGDPVEDARVVAQRLRRCNIPDGAYRKLYGSTSACTRTPRGVSTAASQGASQPLSGRPRGPRTRRRKR